jgi:hypothetical protein
MNLSELTAELDEFSLKLLHGNYALHKLGDNQTIEDFILWLESQPNGPELLDRLDLLHEIKWIQPAIIKL